MPYLWQTLSDNKEPLDHTRGVGVCKVKRERRNRREEEKKEERKREEREKKERGKKEERGSRES